jgi:hypothetical protein
MGWSGYGIYAGDGTQSCHHDFLQWMKVTVGKKCDEVFEWMSMLKTKIPKDRRPLLRKNYKLALKKMPKLKWGDDEDIALEWQMLLSLFIDNEVKPPKIIKDQGIRATKWLMGEHAADFNNPGARRKSLRDFLARVEKVCKEK